MLCPIGQSNEKPPLQALAKWREDVTRKNTLTLTTAGESLYRYAKFINMAVGEYASAHNEHFMVDEHWIQLMTRVMCMAAVAFQNESREIHE